MAELRLQIDIARHIHRPNARAATAGQNFLYSAATGQTRPLSDDQLIRQLPVSHRICRVYVPKGTPPGTDQAVATALDSLLGGSVDDLTNMYARRSTNVSVDTFQTVVPIGTSVWHGTSLCGNARQGIRWCGKCTFLWSGLGKVARPC